MTPETPPPWWSWAPRFPKAAIAATAGGLRYAGRRPQSVCHRQWRREHPELAQELGFTRAQTPCVATLHLVFRRLDGVAFEDALSQWAMAALPPGAAARAVDGKALRGLHGDELPGVRLVAA